MNALKRATVYLRRNMFHSIVLFLIIFLLGILSLGAVSAYRMIANTEENMWANFTAIVAIKEDQIALQSHSNSYGGWVDVPITRELIEEIAQLPYVARADISSRYQLYSRNLSRYWDFSAGVDDQRSLRDFRIRNIEIFDLRGITRSDFLELDSGIIQIISGSNFTDEQLANDMPVVLISQEFANTNELHVGSFITLYEVISKGSDNFSNWYNEEYIVDRLEVEFEVIGIYELQGTLNEYALIEINEVRIVGSELAHISQELNMLNLIYTPYGVVEQMLEFRLEARRAAFGFSDADESLFRTVDSFLILDDSRDLPAFHEAVSHLLPDFVIAQDASYSFGNVFLAMDHISGIAVFILIFLIGAALLILSFLIMLILRSRKHEIGIYLALGEGKRTVTFQLTAEVLLVTIAALALALFTNQVVSAQVSRYLVTQEMANVQIEERTHALVVGNHIFMREDHVLDWFVPATREIAELIETFDISLEMTDIIAFYGVAIAVVVLSTFSSTLYIMRLKPREILTFGDH